MMSTVASAEGSLTERSPRPATLRRIAPIACACALASGGVVLASNDPAAANSRYPPCFFRQTTGLWCPGCGLTRGTHQLLNGNVLSAISTNLFTPVVVLAVAWLWVWWVRAAWSRPTLGRTGSGISATMQRSLAFTLPAIVVVYGVLRNVPAAPFRSLAP